MTLNQQHGVKCLVDESIAMWLKAIRTHFTHFLDGVQETDMSKMRMSLASTYSRAKVKFNVNRVDNMVVQGSALLEQLNTDLNNGVMRVREWYGYHFPELAKIVSDNMLYCKLAKAIGDRAKLDESKVPALLEVTDGNEDLVSEIIEASKASVGQDISPIDLLNVMSSVSRVADLADFRQGIESYLHRKMEALCPSTTAVVGDLVGARLITLAGSLTNLAKMPSSTVQILGAEKALFRALKKARRGPAKTPKYGAIFNSSQVGSAKAADKGRMARFLANQISKAARYDAFSENPNAIFGQHLARQCEERQVFLEKGTVPRKNLDVVKDVMEEIAREAPEQPVAVAAGTKRTKRDEEPIQEEEVEQPAEDQVEQPPKKKQKKKKDKKDKKDKSKKKKDKSKKKSKKNKE
ncbi:MAG: hypothetical protein MHM6MM_008177 [Cercozoa sp. M6MM]